MGTWSLESLQNARIFGEVDVLKDQLRGRMESEVKV